MVVFPNAKINLGLHITSKRPDGFHEIESVFYPVPDLRDALEILPARSGGIKFESHGIDIPTDGKPNLCERAVQMVLDNLQDQSIEHNTHWQIHLLKKIPIGAGLGGGSADGAFALKLINDLTGKHLERNQLLQLAESLGSDCPFFIDNQPKYITGKGESMEDFSYVLEGYKIEFIHPPIHISTAEAYAAITPTPNRIDIREVLNSPTQNWKTHLINDFQTPMEEKYPAIKAAIDQLYQKGAFYAAMTGSGSSVFGVFKK